MLNVLYTTKTIFIKKTLISCNNLKSIVTYVLKIPLNEKN